MFDYTRRMQLFARDTARRASFAAGAGVVILIGSGFLLAALWSWLADGLGWGATGASLSLGAGLLVVGLILLLAARRRRHIAPTTDELRSEIEQKLSLATDVALDRISGRAEQALESAQTKASMVVDAAGNRLNSLVDSVSYNADRIVGGAEAKAFGLMRRAGDGAKDRLGLSVDQERRMAEGFDRAKSSNLAAVAPVIGAFAIGLTLASRIAGSRRDTGDDDGYEDEWDDER